ncbi:MAG: divergent polysaccharide deacetylase family protein [Proteobacteria bacterium]|nr:divergent polysaccharide deacetylase family protein [Pseudomonadota bacterium]
MRKLLRCLSWALLLSLAMASPVRSDGDAHLLGAYEHIGEDGVYEQILTTPPAPTQNANTVNSNLPAASVLPQAVPPSPSSKPMIAIVIDDVGVDQKRSARAVNELNAAVTLSYLAYSSHVLQQVAAAKAHGHEIMLHLPWEADNAKEDPGPNHLSVSMSTEQIQKNLLANLDGFTGYVGVNNHMGSRFSRYRPGLELVMAELQKRHVFYLDSKTTPNSIAEKVAREYNVPTTHRDVFLDHDENSKMVRTSLEEVEAIARRKGSAVAIGHPKDPTLAAVEAWLPTLETKGFQLVPLTTVISYRQMRYDAHMAHLEADKK